MGLYKLQTVVARMGMHELWRKNSTTMDSGKALSGVRTKLPML